MKKLLNFVPLLLLCSCLTTAPSSLEEHPGEPELEVITESGDVEIDTTKNPVVIGGTEAIELIEPKEVKLPLVKTVVIMKTSLGDVTIELDPAKAPVTVKNFLDYVDNKYYNNTIFHRVMSNFMVQGGGFTEKMQEKKTKKPIENEAYNGLSNMRGTLAMARTNVVDSATSQFFINVKDNLFLDHKDKSARKFGYCVFGRVIDGMDVVDKIRRVKTESRGYTENVPVKTIMIKEIVRAKKK